MEREQLRAWRERRGLTQTKAARTLHVSGATWQAWEQGRRTIPAWLDVALAGVDARRATEDERGQTDIQA